MRTRPAAIAARDRGQQLREARQLARRDAREGCARRGPDRRPDADAGRQHRGRQQHRPRRETGRRAARTDGSPASSAPSCGRAPAAPACSFVLEKGLRTFWVPIVFFLDCPRRGAESGRATPAYISPTRQIKLMSIGSMRLWYLRPLLSTDSTPLEKRESTPNASNSPSLRRRRGGWRARGCGACGRQRATTITISGATASYPLVQLLAQKYVKLHKHKVKFKIAQGGSHGRRQRCRRRPRDDRRRLARPALTPTSRASIFYPIAKYAICVITNKANTLGEPHDRAARPPSSPARPARWSGVSGASASGTIDLISRTLGRRRAHQLPDAAAGRQESRERRRRRVLRGPDASRRSKTTPTRSASCPTTSPTKAACTSSRSTAWLATGRRPPPAPTRASRASTR